MGEFWVGIGIGFLLGAIVFDQAWRVINRMQRRLDVAKHGGDK